MRTKISKQLFIGLSAFTVMQLATGLTSGNESFAKNCAACHNGGGNIMRPDKTLSKADLENNGMNSVEAIKDLIIKGKSPMPAFGKVLDKKQINGVAKYVLEQAEKGW